MPLNRKSKRDTNKILKNNCGLCRPVILLNEGNEKKQIDVILFDK